MIYYNDNSENLKYGRAFSVHAITFKDIKTSSESESYQN